MNDTISEVNRLFDLQKKESAKNPFIPVEKRKANLKKLLRKIFESELEIQKAVYEDFKKPAAEVKLTEIFTVTSEIKHAIRHLKKWTKPQRVKTPLTFFGSSNKVFYEPKGTVLVLAPWNFPFQLALGPIVSALAAGNRIILKPSEKSPHTSAFLYKFLSELFDEKEVAVILGDHVIAEELVRLPFDHIFFTGSTETGKKVMTAAAQNLTPVTLELGGKSPTIIHQSADLKSAAYRIAWGKFMNCGQTCIAPDYVLIKTEMQDEFINLVKSAVESYFGKVEKIKEDANYCRLINDDHYKRLNDILQSAIEHGAEIKFGGIVEEDNKYISPTLITNVSLDSRIMKEEIFGPILPVITYSDYNELTEIINNNPDPLALYVFAKDKKFIKKIISEIPAGSSAVNDVVVHFVNYNLPFGGRKTSGMGKAHGYYGFREFSNEKSLMKQPKLTSLRFLYPPYTPIVKKLIDLTVKYF
ncbi:MAG: aldehyde dehydrogenase family protein [Melioribacteraceae bacterium]|nr:aldehyde dehydrogenase family protein [Melioribacteraceae bacterium]MCF8354978.1 aldehyde dehydrogenase family protein [Melioribacteraceae bacterium]MCF8394005.1 aldehyde dehydrogenase family protein [Melioribacteraceae bacterium]MCF8419792.1 aldehyde dehydrogenase family protein [Melioribacteraceae bacterium]